MSSRLSLRTSKSKDNVATPQDESKPRTPRAGAGRSQSPLKSADAKAAPKRATPEEEQQVTSWISEMDSLEKKQMQIQADQMHTLHSQINLLSRELGNMQKEVLTVREEMQTVKETMEQMGKDLSTAQEEAHAALRVELAEHGSKAEDMKAAWEEAHKALSKAMDDGLATQAKDLADAVESQNTSHQKISDDLNMAHSQIEAKLKAARAAYDRKHADADLKHEDNVKSCKDLENSLQDALKASHNRLHASLAKLHEEKADLHSQFKHEQAKRKDMENKLDGMFGGLRDVMDVELADGD